MKHSLIIFSTSILAFGCSNTHHVESLETENKTLKDSINNLQEDLERYSQLTKHCVMEPYIFPLSIKTSVGQKSKFRILVPEWSVLRNGNPKDVGIKILTELESEHQIEVEDCGSFLYYTPNEPGEETITIQTYITEDNDSITVYGEDSYNLKVI